MLQDLIQNYSQAKERAIDQYRAARQKAEPDEQAAKEANKSNLFGLGATIRFENGYVYDFELGGRLYNLCDQTSRVIGSSWKIQEPEQQKWLEDESEWRNSHNALGTDIRFAVDYRSELKNIPLSQWRPE